MFFPLDIENSLKYMKVMTCDQRCT